MAKKLVQLDDDVSAFPLEEILSFLILFLLICPLKLNLQECLNILVKPIHCILLNIHNLVHGKTVRRVLLVVLAVLMIEDALLADRRVTSFAIVLA